MSGTILRASCDLSRIISFNPCNNNPLKYYYYCLRFIDNKPEEQRSSLPENILVKGWAELQIQVHLTPNWSSCQDRRKCRSFIHDASRRWYKCWQESPWPIGPGLCNRRGFISCVSSLDARSCSFTLQGRCWVRQSWVQTSATFYLDDLG